MMADADIAMQHLQPPKPYPRRTRVSANGDEGIQVQEVRVQRTELSPTAGNGAYEGRLDAQKRDANVEERSQASSVSSFDARNGK